MDNTIKTKNTMGVVWYTNLRQTINEVIKEKDHKGADHDRGL